MRTVWKLPVGSVQQVFYEGDLSCGQGGGVWKENSNPQSPVVSELLRLAWDETGALSVAKFGCGICAERINSAGEVEVHSVVDAGGLGHGDSGRARRYVLHYRGGDSGR